MMNAGGESSRLLLRLSRRFRDQHDLEITAVFPLVVEPRSLIHTLKLLALDTAY